MSPVRFEQIHDGARAAASMEFFSSPLGALLEREEMAVLRQQVDGCFGARGMLIGACHDWRVLDALPVQRRFMAPVAEAGSDVRRPVSSSPASIIDPANLPFANGSLDVLVLFHALDLAVYPQQALREAARVLGDDGQLLITGFNPWSLWGIRRLFTPRRAPWNANFINPVRMLDWLALLDFRVSQTEFVRFWPGLRPRWTTRRSPMRMVKLPLGGAWIMHARRQPPARIPMTERLRPARPALGARQAAPSASSQVARRDGNVLELNTRRRLPRRES